MQGGRLSFTSDLIEHILNTKDATHKDGKYVLNGMEAMDVLEAIPIPKHATTLKQAYLMGSIIRRMISYIQEGNPKEALKLAHELSMVYEQKEDKP